MANNSYESTLGSIEVMTSLGETILTSQTGNVTNLTSLEGEFQFNRRLLLNVIAYSVMFVIGTIGNTVVSIH